MELGDNLHGSEGAGSLEDALRQALMSATSNDIEFSVAKTGADHGFGGVVDRNPEIGRMLTAYYEEHGGKVEEVAANRLTVTGLPGGSDGTVYWAVITDPQDESKIQVRLHAPRVT